MANNAFLVLLVLGAVSIGTLGGYFVFLGMYQEQFAHQDLLSVENFDSINVSFKGIVVSSSDKELIVQRGDRIVPIFLSPDAKILISDKSATAPVEGTWKDLVQGREVLVTATFGATVIQARRVIEL